MSHRNCPQIEDVPSFTDPRLLWTPPLHWTQAPQQESPGDGRVRESEEGAAVTATATATVSECLCPTPPLLLCTVVQTILSGSAPGPQPSHPLQVSVGWSHLTSGQGCLSTHFQNSRLPGAPGPTQSHTPLPTTPSSRQGSGPGSQEEGQGGAVYLYSRENLVSSLLLWSHLNSSGQLPSAMHVSTRRFPSRCTCVRTGSVLKYGDTSSAETWRQSRQWSPARPCDLVVWYPKAPRQMEQVQPGNLPKVPWLGGT